MLIKQTTILLTFLLVSNLTLPASAFADEAEHTHDSSCSGGHLVVHEAADTHDDHEDHNHLASHEDASPTVLQTMTVPLATQQTMGLKTVSISPHTAPLTQRFVGRYELCPEARQIVSAPIAGLLEIRVATLTHVKKGDLLATLSAPERQARAAELVVLEKRLETYRKLNQANAALEAELAIKQADYQAQLLGMEEQAGVLFLRAPVDGWIESLNALTGAWVEPGSPILQLAQPKALRVKSVIPAAEAVRLREGQDVMVEGVKGTLHLGIGDATGLVPVYTVFEQPIETAIAGMRTTVQYARSGSESAQQMVPKQSLVTVGVQTAVFIRDAHDATRLLLMPVSCGERVGDWCIVKGLPEHALDVVTDGTYELKLALPNHAAPAAGHFHADGVYHEGEH